jgi:anti-sigma B factor antagonist
MATDRSPTGRDGDPLRAPAPGELPGDRARTPGSELDVACQEQADLILLALVGELDTYTTPGFQEYARRYDPGEVQLVIDLAGVTFLDSAGLSALLSLRTQAERTGAGLGLVCPDPGLLRLFWFTGLGPLFVFGGDLATVRAALSDQSGEATYSKEAAMQIAWSKLQEAVRKRIGRDRSEDAHDASRAEDEDAARAEDEGYPLGRPDQVDDPDSHPSRAPKDETG